MTDGERIKLLVTIVDRGKGSAAVDIYRARNMHFDYLCMGLGTANSKILDYFGLSETEKDVVITLAPQCRMRELMEAMDRKFQLDRPGRGILFTCPLSGVSAQVPKILCRDLAESEKGENSVENAVKYDLILAIVNRGCLDTAMDAAREAGARGGTVLHARRVGKDDGENLLGFALQPEKEIVAILSPRSQKQSIMLAINQAAGLTTEAKGILFSLPVDDMIGLQSPVKESE